MTKKVAVLGFGVEGKSVVDYFLKKKATITVFDEKKTLENVEPYFAKHASQGVTYVFGSFPELTGFDLVVFSPGIRPDILPLTLARKSHIPVTTATNIFLERVPCKTIGVTGTKGKGTTASLITEMLKADGIDAYLGGNIGTPPLEFLDKLTEKSVVVLELSSFQTFTMEKGVDMAVILMTTSEHLDYHKDTDEYVDAKLNLVRKLKTSGSVCVNIDYPNSLAIGEKSGKRYFQVSLHRAVDRGAYVKDGMFLWADGKKIEEISSVTSLHIPGKHNWENALSAIVAVKKYGVSNSAIQKALSSFTGLPHRIELVADIEGVRFYDDSFSTTPETTIAAIRSFQEPKILILGGSSKNSDFTDLGEEISKSESIRAIIGIGIEWDRIKSQIPNPNIQCIVGCQNMQEIVAAAWNVTEPGDVVLLSPACASFDMFNNYKERGEQFKKWVLALSVQR